MGAATEVAHFSALKPHENQVPGTALQHTKPQHQLRAMQWDQDFRNLRLGLEKREQQGKRQADLVGQ